MKYFIYLLLLLPLFAGAQEDFAITDRLMKWDALTEREEVIGHYAVTVTADETLKKGIFTLSILGPDLQYLGGKTYPASATLNVQDVAYYRDQLGVLVQEKDGAKVEIIDGSGATLQDLPLAEEHSDGSGLIYPVTDGFLVIHGFKQKANRVLSEDNFLLQYFPAGGDGKGWTKSLGSKAEKNISYGVQLMDSKEDVLLLQVCSNLENNRTGQVTQCGLLAVEATTGKELFTYYQQTGVKDRYPVILAARVVNERIRMLVAEPEYLEKDRLNRGATRLIDYDLSGEQIGVVDIDLHALLDQWHRDERKLVPDENSEFLRRHTVFNDAGGFSLVVEPFLQQRKKVIYTDQFVMSFDPEGGLQQVVSLPRTPFTMPAYFIGLNTGVPIFGPSEDQQRLAQTLMANSGPLNLALSTHQGGVTCHYFWDRSFSETGVDYKGIEVIVAQDGQLSHEHINYTEARTPYLYPARAGYVLRLDYDGGRGGIVPRLEKLNY